MARGLCDDTNTLNVHIHALRQELSKYTNLTLLLSKLFGDWAIRWKDREVKNEIKKLYFSGVSSFDSTNDFGRFWAVQRMLIEKSEVYFLVGMTLIASFIGAAVSIFLLHLFFLL